MKNYLLGVLVLALAIGFSAFTTARRPAKANEASYFWYDISGSLLGTRLGDIDGVPTTYTQTEAMDEDLTLCQNDGSIRCIAGVDQSNASGQSLPQPTQDADNFVTGHQQ